MITLPAGWYIEPSDVAADEDDLMDASRVVFGTVVIGADTYIGVASGTPDSAAFKTYDEAVSFLLKLAFPKGIPGAEKV